MHRTRVPCVALHYRGAASLIAPGVRVRYGGRMRWNALPLLLALGCQTNASLPAPAIAPPTTVTTAQPRCAAEPFATELNLPEASGAAVLPHGTSQAIVVTSDSGHHGKYALLHPDTGQLLRAGEFPIAGGSDDIEGLAYADNLLFGITSAGWIYRWRLTAEGFDLAGEPTPLATPDPSLPVNGGYGDKPPVGESMACVAHSTNCGRNYEGLCLHAPLRDEGCTGWAAAKADGHLYCLRVSRDAHGLPQLTVDRSIKREVAKPGALADCTIDGEGRTWVGLNLFGRSQAIRLADPALATSPATVYDDMIIGFPEAMTTHGPFVYRFSDAGGAPSLMGKYRCQP